MTRQLHLQHQQTTTTTCNHQMANKLIKQNKLNKMKHLHPVSSKRRRRQANCNELVVSADWRDIILLYSTRNFCAVLMDVRGDILFAVRTFVYNSMLMAGWARPIQDANFLAVARFRKWCGQ
jgi:hypothetical protein